MKILFFLLLIIQNCYAGSVNFDSKTKILTIPHATINQNSSFRDIELLLQTNNWQLLQAIPQVNTTDLPLLSAGKHLSIIHGFNAVHPEQTLIAMDQRWNEALSKGMKTGRIQIDWADLEPTPQQYQKEKLENTLKAMQADGLQTFVLLSTVDSEGFTLPPDLVDPQSGTHLANEMQLDNPVILERFNKLLDWVVPMVVSYGGWVLSVGNEPGNYLEHTPSAEQSFVNFLASARAHSHSINPELAITITLAQLPLERNQNFHQQFIANSDVACFNYYASNPDYDFEDLRRINQEIDQILQVAGDKQLIMQELGAAGGYEDKATTMKASLALQQQFFELVFKKMAMEPRFRAAFVFQLVDWEPSLVNTSYSQLFIEAGFSQNFIDRFAESLETVGLLRYKNGSKRPAWDTFLFWVEQFSNPE